MIESMVSQVCGFLNKPNVNDVRYEKCCWEKFLGLSKIPPTRYELHQHVKRVNYQKLARKNALEVNQEIPESDQHGWSMIDENYKVHWINNQTTSDKILELIACDCKKKNVLNNINVSYCKFLEQIFANAKYEFHNEVPESFLYDFFFNFSSYKHIYIHILTYIYMYIYIIYIYVLDIYIYIFR